MKKINLLFKCGFIGSILYDVVTSSNHIPASTAKIDIGINNQGARTNQKKCVRNFIFNNKTRKRLPWPGVRLRKLQRNSLI